VEIPNMEKNHDHTMYKFVQHPKNTLNPLAPSTPTLSRARI